MCPYKSIKHIFDQILTIFYAIQLQKNIHMYSIHKEKTDFYTNMKSHMLSLVFDMLNWGEFQRVQEVRIYSLK